MEHLKPPQRLDDTGDLPKVFLAGSIEMGTATDWQSTVAKALRDLDIVVFNPRRDAWDASWPQRPDFAPFREQVEWELEAQESADLIAFYFAPDTRAPVTLLELGLAAGRKRTIVCCPEGYWRKGNVDVVCHRYHIPQAADLAGLIALIRSEVTALSTANQERS
ncbi:MAG: nucleoside 2-deoxyribosyltransferase domain-containing protein [Minicystis sp.]